MRNRWAQRPGHEFETKCLWPSDHTGVDGDHDASQDGCGRRTRRIGTVVVAGAVGIGPSWWKRETTCYQDTP